MDNNYGPDGASYRAALMRPTSDGPSIKRAGSWTDTVTLSDWARVVYSFENGVPQGVQYQLRDKSDEHWTGWGEWRDAETRGDYMALVDILAKWLLIEPLGY